MEFVEKVKLFNGIAGTKEEFNVKMISLYTGLVLEEVAEMLEALHIDDPEVEDLIESLNESSHSFKINDFEATIGCCVDRKEFLDGAVDVAVVALGAGVSIGADVLGACHEVADSNLSKFPIVNGEHVVLKDENGKIMKPESFRRPELGKFLHQIEQ
jgi:predicted HAD superfamily Cof-like phosphohydrolase